MSDCFGGRARVHPDLQTRRTDSGVGISDARLESLFREFEQVSTVDGDNQTLSAPTVGLGLAVVARIVRNLGGQLRVESKEHEGTKFTFVLPFCLPSVVSSPICSDRRSMPTH